ncbi:MAG: alpha-glucosidase, partial [Limisphaerales bacterium]
MPSNTSIKRPKASSSNISAGAITQIRKTPQGVILKLKNGTARLSFYSPEVLRVEVELSDKITESHSYAVVSKPGSVAFELEEKRGGWLLKSKELHVEITKKAFRLCMKTPEGKVLNADDPAFGSAWQGTSCTTYKTLQPEERFIGLGEKSGGVDLKGSAWYNWNTDAFAYGPGTDPLYCSTPFYMGIHAAGSYGIFFDNSHKSRFNFGASGNRFSFFNAEDGPMNYYFFSGSVEDIVKQYSKLTGKMPMPPKWALGFQQCRYSYYPDLQIHNKAITFRQRDIPADVLYLDIHYMDKYKVFSWDEDRFPDPEKLMSSLEAMGFKVVVIVDPGVKVEKGYKPYDSGIKNDHFVPYPDGTYYQGDVWPGTCHFPDYTNPKTRKWWSKQVKEFVKCGIAGVWNDMNEPATWGQDMPDLMEFDFEGEGGTHKKARNIYGQNMARATREGLGDKNTRPFVLTRAGYAGIQRYAAVWTGDNVASDEHMLLGARMLANMGISGMPFTGYDVGGFVGESDPQLYSRWISLGAFSPFFRGHSMINTRSSEPWAYGEEAEANAKNYINLRYKLLPYIYAQFREAALTGIPVVRSMTLNWADDSRIYDEEFMNQYL